MNKQSVMSNYKIISKYCIFLGFQTSIWHFNSPSVTMNRYTDSTTDVGSSSCTTSTDFCFFSFLLGEFDLFLVLDLSPFIELSLKLFLGEDSDIEEFLFSVSLSPDESSTSGVGESMIGLRSANLESLRFFIEFVEIFTFLSSWTISSFASWRKMDSSCRTQSRRTHPL